MFCFNVKIETNNMFFFVSLAHLLMRPSHCRYRRQIKRLIIPRIEITADKNSRISPLPNSVINYTMIHIWNLNRTHKSETVQMTLNVFKNAQKQKQMPWYLYLYLYCFTTTRRQKCGLENWEIKSLTISNETRLDQDKNWDKTALNCNTMPQKAPCPLYLGYAADFKSPAFITAQSHFSAQCLKIISKHQLWTILCLIVRDMIVPRPGEQ